MRKRGKLSVSTALSILLLAAVLLMLTLGISMVRNKLLQNTQELGMSLAKSYAGEVEMKINTYSNFMNLGAQYVEEFTQADSSPEQLQSWLHSYFAKLTVLLGENMLDPYAVVDGQIVAANPWSGDGDYDYQGTDWYQAALEAGGELIFTDAYIDAITGMPVITAARQLSSEGDVLAMDLYTNAFRLQEGGDGLPGDYSFYLADSAGNLIYANNHWNVSQETLQDYTDQLLQGIRDGSLFAYDATFADPNGVQRGVYYHEMSNGWTVIITVPLESVLMGDRSITMDLLILGSILLFLVLTAMVVRDLVQHKKIRRADDTIHILGDSFYAIYRVNYRDGTYDAIKNSEDMEQVLSKGGSYSVLLDTIKELVEPGTFQEFERCFSLESIRQRVAEKIPDYGGDYRRRFGEAYKWVNIRTLYDGERAPDEVILCFRVVDEEKRQQLQHTILLQEALETAKKSTKAKSAFFSRMSHDMRTPLNAIIGLSQLAQEHAEEREKIRDYMGKINFAGKQLLTLINDILELSRLESEGNTVENEKFDLKKCVENIGGIFQEQARREEKTFTVTMQIEDTMVRGDEFKLGQILNNLLSNAFKYSEAGAKVELSVRQFVFQQHSKYQFVVEDTGIGMSEQFLSHIFDPYAREAHFATQKVMGTGLGMPIVKSLVQQMSGEISVESTLGQGSKFTVTLPMTTESGEESAPQPVDEGEKETFQLAGRRVLLAEDNELNMEIATEVLTMHGVEVVQAYNGAEAVREFQASAPYAYDAILMDMQMPEMDGCQAARAIRQLDRPDAAVPIVAVTANAFAEDIAKTTEAGMNGHISKPIDFSVLCQTLEGLMACRKER